MKQLIITTLLIISFLSFNAQSLTKENYSSIKTFLVEFKENAEKQNSSKLSEMVEHYEVEDKKVHEFIIENAIKDNEELGSDFAYSNKAMQIIINDLVNEFVPLTEKIREILNKNDAFNKMIHQVPNDHIAMLNHGKAHVILILKKNGVKLLFWENMNSLIH